MKYKDQNWPDGTPIAGKSLSANGEYVGEQVGSPMQGKDETAANADPFYTAHHTVHCGTITPDAGDKNFPVPLYEVFYRLNGAIGQVPATQVQSNKGAAILLSAAPVIYTYPSGKTAFKQWNTKADGTGTVYAAGASLTPSADTVLYGVYQ